jgi:hypothetical protein
VKLDSIETFTKKIEKGLTEPTYPNVMLLSTTDAGMSMRAQRTGDSKKPCNFNGAVGFQVPLRIHEGFERYGFSMPNTLAISAT